MKDYYRILGVEQDASQGDITKAFRKLAHRYHPDKQGGDVNKFKEVNEAYQVLNNPEKRSQYDAGGGQQFGGFGGFDFSNVHINFDGTHAGGFADAINSMFRSAMNRGKDVQVDVPLSFEESVYGVRRSVHIPYRQQAPRTLEVPVPAGVESGTTLRMTGMGEPSKDGKGHPGDLYVRISVKDNPNFRRHGGDIVFVLELPLTEALLGTVREIRDIRGEKLSVTVPEMSVEGTPIVFNGKGIPQPAGTGRLVVVCKIVYPRKMSKKSKELLNELKKEGW